MTNFSDDSISKIKSKSEEKDFVFVLESFEADMGLTYDIYLPNKEKIVLEFSTLCGIEKSAEDIVEFLGFDFKVVENVEI